MVTPKFLIKYFELNFRSGCFTSPYFTECMNSLLVDDKIKNHVGELQSSDTNFLKTLKHFSGYVMEAKATQPVLYG